nr:MauE/DoxX family redox-associated membrane protein [Bacillus altitudinis]
MSVFYFIGVYLLGIIFAGASLDKARKQKAHVQQINAYRLLPPSFAAPMFYVFLLIELVCTIHLFIWNMSILPRNWPYSPVMYLYWSGYVQFN